MRIDDKNLHHWIEHYYGYGSWNARMWFVSHEEGGGDLPEEVAEKLHYFFTAHRSAVDATLCDIREYYKHVSARLDGSRAGVFRNLYEYRFGPGAMQHGPWKNLIAFIHGYRREKAPDPLEYQKNTFLSTSSGEALIQLYPLPSPHNHAWYYSWLDMPQFPFLKSRALYEEHLYNDRIQHILRNIAQYKPELVLMYGMANINRLKKSVQDFFPGAEFKMVKGTKLQIPQHHSADLNGSRLLITTQIPALRHNRIETGFDWEAFGNTL